MISYKKIFLLFYLMLIMLLSTACDSKDMEEYMREVKSTNLLAENIDGIVLSMDITNDKFQAKYGHAEPDQANDYYSAEGRQYDQYWIDKLMLSVDRETNEILSISILEKNYISSSEKGIKLGDPIKDVISAYGNNFYSYKDSEQSIYIIGYVDHRNNLTLSFLHYDDKVTGISYGYVFDRLNWIK